MYPLLIFLISSQLFRFIHLTFADVLKQSQKSRKSGGDGGDKNNAPNQKQESESGIEAISAYRRTMLVALIHGISMVMYTSARLSQVWNCDDVECDKFTTADLSVIAFSLAHFRWDTTFLQKDDHLFFLHHIVSMCCYLCIFYYQYGLRFIFGLLWLGEITNPSQQLFLMYKTELSSGGGGLKMTNPTFKTIVRFHVPFFLFIRVLVIMGFVLYASHRGWISGIWNLSPLFCSILLFAMTSIYIGGLIWSKDFYSWYTRKFVPGAFPKTE